MYKFLFKNKYKTLIFGGISKFRLWAHCSFGQFWADFDASVVYDSMPELWQKSLKPHNF
jgi:hypothetical protein